MGELRCGEGVYGKEKKEWVKVYVGGGCGVVLKGVKD